MSEQQKIRLGAFLGSEARDSLRTLKSGDKMKVIFTTNGNNFDYIVLINGIQKMYVEGTLGSLYRKRSHLTVIK